jgi:hypothetical protein
MSLASFQEAQMSVSFRACRINFQQGAPLDLGLSIVALLFQRNCCSAIFRRGCHLARAARSQSRQRDRKHDSPSPLALPEKTTRNQ